MTFLNAERKNFLRRCWPVNRWPDAVGLLVHPLRQKAYATRRKLRRSHSAFNRSAARTSVPTVAISPETPPVFRDQAFKFTHPVMPDPFTFEWAEEQLRGEIRLAGGVLRLNDPSQWNDKEDHHSFHRLYWAVRYARAAALGHAGALDGLNQELKRWVELNPQDSVAQAPYTVAERIASLAEVLFWMSDRWTANQIVAAKTQIFYDAHRLTGAIEYSLGVHNHLLNDARGLFAAAAILREQPEATHWQKLAFQLWETYFPQLVLADGTFSEQSSHYHLLLCRTALEYFLACMRTGRQISKDLLHKLRAMFRLADCLLRPDGSLPRFGDNSPDHAVEELWGVLAAAYDCGLLDITPRHGLRTLLTCYYGLSPLRAPSPRAIAPGVLCTAGGFAFLRSQSAELAVHADPNPNVEAHGDCGRGTFEYWNHGVCIIKEPGCFKGPGGPGSELSDPAGQNITCVDGLSPVIAAVDRSLLPAWYETGIDNLLLYHSEICLTSRAFARVQSDMELTRTWSLDSSGNLHMKEKISGGSRALVTSRLHLAGSAWCVSQQGSEFEFSRVDANQAVLLRINLPVGWKAELIEGLVCTEYGVVQQAQVVFISGVAEFPTAWTMQCEVLPLVQTHAGTESREVCVE